MWKTCRLCGGSSSRLPYLLLLLLLAMSSAVAQSAPQAEQTEAEATRYWRIKYETLQTGVIEIVPLLEAELQTAKNELSTSIEEKRKTDEALRQSQTDLTVSESERNRLKAESMTLSNQIDAQQKRINELLGQLREVYDLWKDSEASRTELVNGVAILQARIQEEQAAREHAERDRIVIGIAAGVGGVLVGIAVTVIAVEVKKQQERSE